MDSGSWALVWELALEPEPPYHAMGSRPAEPWRLPRPSTCDPRWAEVAMGRLRDVDDYNERRRRLADGRPPLQGGGGEPLPKHPGKGPGKGNPKGKTQPGKGASAPPEG